MSSATYNIEISQDPTSCFAKEKIIEIVKEIIKNVAVVPGTMMSDHCFAEHKNHISAITFCELDQDINCECVNVQTTEIIYHVYRLDQFSGDVESMNAGDEEDLPAAVHWQLPSIDFFGLWESLIYDTKVKEDTLNFVETTLLFSDKHIDTNIINWNRVILLHGPPGTGKTSLCKALAQKLSIRLSARYASFQLIEINSHSLFSKWFSESGKLVMKLFNKIKEFVENPDLLVCVLIDEIESLTHARKAALTGSEPSDSIRVVNAILTQLDQIRKYPNVLILTTSNMTGAIDLAFVDRADIKQYIGPPSARAIYEIYCSCIRELMRCHIIAPTEELFSHRCLEICQYESNESTRSSLDLFQLAKQSVGLSGRSLRKIPFLAHALFIKKPSTDLGEFLTAMKSAIVKHMEDSKTFANGN